MSVKISCFGGRAPMVDLIEPQSVSSAPSKFLSRRQSDYAAKRVDSCAPVGTHA